MKTKTAILLIIITGLVVYFNSLFNGFVWDDEEQVLNNTLVHSLSNLPQFFKSSTFNSGGTGSLGGLYYKPLMTTAFSLIYTIFGPNPFFFHLFQVSLHIISSVLVFLVLKYFFKKQSLLPLVLAVIFLIHPLNTEAVVYISDLQDILFFFFGILALYIIIKQQLTLKSMSLIVLLFLSSLLSKETGAIFILITGVYLSLFRRKDLLKYSTAVLAILGIYSFLRFTVAGIFFKTHGLSPITIMPLLERILSIPKIIFSYLKTFLFPQNLAINQHWAVREISFNEFILPLIFDILFFSLIFGVGVLLWKRRSNFIKEYIFFLSWFIFGLGLHLQIIPLDLTYSDRWFYLPMVGLLGMMGVVIQNFKIKNLDFKIFSLVLVSLIILALSIRTIIRNSDWKNGLSLYSHDIQIAKDSFDLENNLGVELFRVGKMEEAEGHFQRSTQLAPAWWTNWNNLGVILERKKDYQKAAKYYQKAIDNGNYYLAYENLANLLLWYEDPTASKEFIEEALKKLPQNAKLWQVLSLAEYKLGNQERALQAAQKSFQLNPNKQIYYIYSRLSANQPLEF